MVPNVVRKSKNQRREAGAVEVQACNFPLKSCLLIQPTLNAVVRFSILRQGALVEPEPQME
ncbi:MAG: hypothetical protein COA41_19145 [Sphingopyxis sp.]|nr:MAG: hypothetical protein COA41_19145 [Sphingopyxis sp.]